MGDINRAAAPRPLHYILDDHGQPVACGDDNASVLRWAQWFCRNLEQRVVLRTVIEPYRVSTVFLGLDHRFVGDGPPVLWETMIFTSREASPSFGDYQERYASRESAVAGHTRAVDAVLAARRAEDAPTGPHDRFDVGGDS